VSLPSGISGTRKEQLFSLVGEWSICIQFSSVLWQWFDTHTHVHAHAHTHTHRTFLVLRFSGFCPRQPGWASTTSNIHLLTPIMVISHPLSASSIYYDPWHPPCSIYVTDNRFLQSLSEFSLVYLLTCTLHFILHTFLYPFIVFFLQHMPIPSQPVYCSTEIMSFNPSLSLNPLLGTLSWNFMPHIHLTILISARWSATSFSFLTGLVSVPCNILLCTQLLYSLPLTISDISLLVSSGTNCLNLFHQHLCLHSTCHLNNKTYTLTPDLHWHQYLHLSRLAFGQ